MRLSSYRKYDSAESVRFPDDRSDAEWRDVLSDVQYQVLRKGATERPWSGEYCVGRLSGGFSCAGCGSSLFDGDDKFDSGSGWPSFTQACATGRVVEVVDRGLIGVRTEVRCANCGGHLGHVFDDGPGPGGRRYCINSVALVVDDAGSTERT
jgi:peptide-methionine (R)-S-oxide reductase